YIIEQHIPPGNRMQPQENRIIANKFKRRKRRSSFDEKVLAELSRLAETDDGPTAIHAALVAKFGEANVPAKRTVELHLAKLRPPDPSGPWVLGELIPIGDPGTVRLIAEALAEVTPTDPEAPRLSRLTRAQAERIAWVRRFAT